MARGCCAIGVLVAGELLRFGGASSSESGSVTMPCAGLKALGAELGATSCVVACGRLITLALIGLFG